MIFNLMFGLAGGLLTASWGAFKDSPYEGFSPFSFFRSLVATSLFYFSFLFLLSEANFFSHNLAILFSAVAIERLVQEYWKAFFRPKQRDEIYKIPQSFHVLGKVLKYKNRLLVGVVLSALTIFVTNVLFKITVLDNSWIIPGLVLSALPSVGGAWKDAPIEGFDIKKFPRSFIIMFSSIFLLSHLTNNLMVLVLGAAGLERLLVEFYKTFLVLSTPGKFNSSVAYPEWKEKRKVFVISYATAIAILVTVMMLSR